MVDLNGHEAGNGGYSQGTPTARRAFLYSEIAHRRIVAGREILRNHGQNNNSPCTASVEAGNERCNYSSERNVRVAEILTRPGVDYGFLFVIAMDEAISPSVLPTTIFDSPLVDFIIVAIKPLLAAPSRFNAAETLRFNFEV